MFVDETQIRVRYAETDQMNVVYYGNYAQYLEVARAELIRSLGFTYKDMESMGVIMPVVELHMKFVQPARYDDLLIIRTILHQMPADHRIEFHHEIYNENHRLVAKGRVILFFMDMKTMAKSRMPRELEMRLEKYFSPRTNPASAM